MPDATTKKTHRRDTYMELVLRCPLKTIKTRQEHAAASAMISELMGRKLDSGSSDYLDTQIVLVTKYDDDREPISDFANPRDAMRALMKANNLTQADIGRLIGSDSAVSMFLNGSRELSKKHVKALAAHFKVEPGLLL